MSLNRRTVGWSGWSLSSCRESAEMKESLALKHFLERQFGERGMVTESTVHTPSVREPVGSVTDEVM